jgi:hypothetical protein
MTISSKLINIMSTKPSCKIEAINPAPEPHPSALGHDVRPLSAFNCIVGQRVNASLLAAPARGLAWSNPNISNEVLVRNALMKGAYVMVLEAVLEHGLRFVHRQWALMEVDSDVALTALMRAEISRKLTNIERGLKLAAA